MVKAKLSRPVKAKPSPVGVANAISVAGVSRRGKFPTTVSVISEHSPKSSPSRSLENDKRLTGFTDADSKLQEMYDDAAPGQCFTLDQIAQTIGVTKERVRQIEFAAIKKIYPKLAKIFKDDGISLEDALQTLRAPHDNRSDPGMEDS